MKKIFLSVIILFGFTLNANSQEQKELGMSAGNITLEVNFFPADNTPIRTNFIKGRYFLDSQTAVRAGFLFDINSQTNEVGDTETINRTVDFGLIPGIEKHFAVSDRVSPYFGAEFGFFTSSSRDIEERDGNTVADVRNATGDNRFILNAIAGVDVYIYKGLYMGLELNYGFQRQSFKDTERTTGDTTTSTEDNRIIYNLSDNVNAAIRLGWSFSL